MAVGDLVLIKRNGETTRHLVMDVTEGDTPWARNIHLILDPEDDQPSEAT